MTRNLVLAMAGCLAVATIAPQPVFAQYRDGSRHQRVKRHASAPYAQRGCVQLCVADVTPCDPPEYKAADGRCNDPFFLF